MISEFSNYRLTAQAYFGFTNLSLFKKKVFFWSIYPKRCLKGCIITIRNNEEFEGI